MTCGTYECLVFRRKLTCGILLMDHFQDHINTQARFAPESGGPSDEQVEWDRLDQRAQGVIRSGRKHDLEYSSSTDSNGNLATSRAGLQVKRYDDADVC